MRKDRSECLSISGGWKRHAHTHAEMVRLDPLQHDCPIQTNWCSAKDDNEDVRTIDMGEPRETSSIVTLEKGNGIIAFFSNAF